MAATTAQWRSLSMTGLALISYRWAPAHPVARSPSTPQLFIHVFQAFLSCAGSDCCNEVSLMAL